MIIVVNKLYHVPTPLDIYVGRGSALGNPYTSQPLSKTKALYQAKNKEDSLEKYEAWLEDAISKKNKDICSELNKIYALAKVGEVYLVCYCAPTRCHADIIKTKIEEKLNYLCICKCKKCGLIDESSFSISGKHIKQSCGSCGAYQKFYPQDQLPSIASIINKIASSSYKFDAAKLIAETFEKVKHSNDFGYRFYNYWTLYLKLRQNITQQ
jgi:hypothetical protein